MKNFKNIILTFLLVVTGTISCRKLDEQVFSSVAINNFYKSAQDAEAAITAAYGPIADMNAQSCVTLASDFSNDQTWPKPVVGRNVYAIFTYDVDYSAQKSFGRVLEGPQGIWQHCYKGIENANWVIAKVPAIIMDQTRKNSIIGEALFLRAYYHFTLAKNFKDVIIRTTPSYEEADVYVAKSPMSDVYKQVMKDLDASILLLTSYASNTIRGRATKEVAIGQYAKTALYAEDWANARDKALQVINSGKYSLMTNVLDVYDVEKENAARSENMFAFEGDNNNPGNTSIMMGLCGPPNSAGRDYGNSTFGSIFGYMSFYNSFNPIDKRRLLMDTFYINVAGNRVKQSNIVPNSPNAVLIKKYMDKNSIGGRNRMNTPILRLPDMYLIVAEAEARLNGATSLAYQYINTIRTRAGIPDLTAGLSKDDFIKAVLQERSWEFFAEGDRWYDLTRTNTFLDVIPKAVDAVVFPVRTPLAKHRYFPIPQDEILANPKLVQNPAWN